MSDTAATGDHATKSKSQHDVVKLAADGFGSNASNYDAHRPGYTEEVVRLIARVVTSTSSLCGKSIMYNVLELGAGTGKLTKQLVSEVPPATKYLAVEPSGNFLQALRSNCPNVESVSGSADNIPLPDSSVQAVVCAQSFHWFSDEASLKSIRRVLVPGGLLLLLWNNKNYRHGWLKHVLDQRLKVIQKVGASTKHMQHSGEWKQNIDKSRLFKLSKHHDLAGVKFSGSLDTFLSNVSTVSVYNTLPQEERDACMAELRETITNWPGVDPASLEIPTSTDLYIYTAQDEVQE